jgi:hypothetical protein
VNHVLENFRDGEGVFARTSTVNSCSVPWSGIPEPDDCRHADEASAIGFLQ